MSQKDYCDRIVELAKQIQNERNGYNLFKDTLDPSKPTTANSYFLINKAQGDWAEDLVQLAINKKVPGLEAVDYGRSGSKIAGEEGFDEFFNTYVDELENLGKCPDIIVFDKSELSEGEKEKVEDKKNYGREEVKNEAMRGKAGLEVRSSLFKAKRYRKSAEESRENSRKELDEALSKVREINEKLISHTLEDRSRWESFMEKVEEYATAEPEQSLHTFRITSKIRNPLKRNLGEEEKDKFLNNVELIREEKRNIRKSRGSLSITPKMEDLSVIMTWIQNHDVPHYYVQVFFDEAYIISFEKILELLNTPELEGESYRVEQNEKNQMKHTIHIDVEEAEKLISDIPTPRHYSELLETKNGRQIPYVKFETPPEDLEESTLDSEKIKALFN